MGRAERVPPSPTDASSRSVTGPLRLLVDLNIVLDVVLKREPWYRDAVTLLDAVSGGAAEGYVAGHAIATLYFLVNKANGRVAAVTAVADILSICEVAPMGTQDFQRALALGFADFEDAVQVAAALQTGCTYIVTRNARDFKGSPVQVRTAGELLSLLPPPISPLP